VSVALFIHRINPISICCIILQSAACRPALHFGTLSCKLHEFRIRFIEYKMCVPNFSTSFVWNISHSERILAVIIITVNRFSWKLLVYFSEFIHTWICWQILGVLKYYILLKFVGCEPRSSKGINGRRTVGQTHLTKPIVVLR
jgi:hypothetical protein